MAEVLAPLRVVVLAVVAVLEVVASVAVELGAAGKTNLFFQSLFDDCFSFLFISIIVNSCSWSIETCMNVNNISPLVDK